MNRTEARDVGRSEDLAAPGFEHSRMVSLVEPSSAVPPGPYVIDSVTGHLFPVFRLYEDFNNAFVGGARLAKQGSYRWLQASNVRSSLGVCLKAS
jgi:hypothetical protein